MKAATGAAVRPAATEAALLPVDATWFSRADLGGGITMVDELRADQRLRGTFYAIEDCGETLLVDAGLGLASLRDRMPDLIGEDTRLLLTHAHHDHQGGAHELAHRLVHPAEVDRLANPAPPPLRATDITDPAIRDALDRGGRMPLPDLLLTARPSAAFDVDRFQPVPATPTELVTEGDVIHVGARRLTVLHLPGHTPGSVGLLEEASGTFFSGDAIYDGPIFDFLPESDEDEYIATMQRMRVLDVRLVLGGHGRPLDRFRMTGLIDRYLRQKENRHD